jgi:hypothetical protein
MKLTGAGGQAVPHFMFDNSGTIASNTLPQLLMPRRTSTSHMIIMNLHPTLQMWLQIGSAIATATLTSGVVTSCTVTNAGFGFSLPPLIQFRGGGAGMWPGFLGANDPNSPSPSKPARAHCVMTGSAPNQSVASITIDDGGSGYLVAPYVMIQNDPKDAGGCADPSLNSGNGMLLGANGGSYYINGTCCPTEQMAIFCSTGLNARYLCKWMD